MNTKTLSYTLIGGTLATVFIYASALIYFTWPISELSIDKSAVFGDSFGLLTSLFSGLAFAGLIITILMQKDELALQREELSLTREELSGQKEELKAQNQTLRIQRFENTFFNMLQILESCREDISCKVRRSEPPLQGRNAIERMYKILSETSFYDEIKESHSSYYALSEECLTVEGINKYYLRFYELYGDELGQYFRTLYNIIKLIDRSAPDDDKSTYSNLLRAQLSRNELLLLFYNCLSDLGQKMQPLVKKYQILKHMEATLLIAEHKDIWSQWNSQP